MAITTPHGITAHQIPDQFGRYAIILLALAGIAGVFHAFIVAQLVFSMLFFGGVALVLFSIVARPLGSPQRETWVAALLACGLLTLILGTFGWPSPF
ncbi:MAG TPA: hypothetical protein VGM36_00650 [Rhizomicrobium sp.]|jgi:hypothetical protein